MLVFRRENNCFTVKKHLSDGVNTIRPKPSVSNFGLGNRDMPNQFDKIIKENFRGLTMSLLRKLQGIEHAEAVDLPGKIQRTMERELDALSLAVSLAGQTYLQNVEWQAYNDPDMCHRMLLHRMMTMAMFKYKIPVRSLVILF